MSDTPFLAFQTHQPASRPVSVRWDDGRETPVPTESARVLADLLDPEPLLSPNDAAAVLGVSRPMVLRWIRGGLLEDRPAGSHHQIPLASVEALAEARRAAGRKTAELMQAAETDPDAAAQLAHAVEWARRQIAERDSGAESRSE